MAIPVPLLQGLPSGQPLQESGADPAHYLPAPSPNGLMPHSQRRDCRDVPVSNPGGRRRDARQGRDPGPGLIGAAFPAGGVTDPIRLRRSGPGGRRAAGVGPDRGGADDRIRIRPKCSVSRAVRPGGRVPRRVLAMRAGPTAGGWAVSEPEGGPAGEAPCPSCRDPGPRGCDIRYPLAFRCSLTGRAGSVRCSGRSSTRGRRTGLAIANRRKPATFCVRPFPIDSSGQADARISRPLRYCIPRAPGLTIARRDSFLSA